MQIVAQLRLITSDDEAASLRDYMRQFNAAANFAAKAGFEAQKFTPASLHTLCYHQIRESIGTRGQTTSRAIAKAASVFARDKTKCPTFRGLGGIDYHRDTLTFKNGDQVSLMTNEGRRVFRWTAGSSQRTSIAGIRRTSAKLVLRDGTFYLQVPVEIASVPEIVATEAVGVDLGIAKLATDSDGHVYSGDQVERVRYRHHRQRRRLQKLGTRGAKKKLRRLRRKESLFRRHENHCISKQIVATAQGTARGIGLEELRGIRSRTTVRKAQRARHSGWAFGQLREFIAYKAKLAGVPVVLVDPRNTSRSCSECGHCDKANRKNQAEFRCVQCNYSVNADFNAARNVAFRAQAALASQPQNCQLAHAS